MGSFKRISLQFFVVAIVLLALAMGGLRLAISNIEYFKPELGFLLQRDVHSGIVINRVGGSMRNFNPIVRIDGFSINLPDRSQPLFIDTLEIEFDFWASLREAAPVAYEVSGRLEKVELTRDLNGQWRFNDIAIDTDTDAAELPAIERLLSLVPRYLKLDLRRLLIHDPSNHSSHLLEGVAARILHRGDQFYSEVSAVLPAALGSGLQVKSVITADSSQVYLNASRLQLHPVARLLGFDTRGLKSGALDGEAWLDMSGYSVNSIHGNMALNGGVFQVAADKPQLALDYSGVFNMRIEDSHWQVSNRVEWLAIDGRSVPAFQAQVDMPDGMASERMSAWIDRLPIASLPIVAGQWLPNRLAAEIATGSLQGGLRDMLFEMDFDHPELFRFTTRVEALSSEPFSGIPGVSNLNVDLSMGNNKLSADIYGESVSLDFADQFPAPLQLDSVSMQATLKRQDSGGFLLALDDIIAANEDVNLDGRLRLESDGERAPFLFLRANFNDARASATGKYFPLKLIPAATLDWLQRAIVDGFVPQGDLQFHGPLRDIRELAREQAGEFFVDFAVQDAHIQFAPGWLPAKNGRGRVLFHNVGVEFEVEQGSYENLDQVQASGGIANFSQPVLQLAIAAEADTADAVRVWRDTPVGARFREVLDKIEDMSGRVDTDIDLLLPLGADAAQQSVNVAVDFADAAASVPDWGVELSDIQGQLRLRDQTIDASDIRGLFFGDPVRIDVHSENIAVATRVAVQGNIESGNLLRKLPGYLGNNVSGKSDWRVQLSIAGDAAPALEPVLAIRAGSNLQRTKVDLPLPFQKQPDELTDFDIAIDFIEDRIRFESQWQDNYHGRGQLQRADSGYQLAALDIAMNRELRAMQGRGINLYGNLDELSVDDWLAVFASSEDEGLQLLESVELDIDRALILNRIFKAAKVEVKQVDGRFLGLVDSTIATGSFEWPIRATSEDPVQVNFDYLVIDRVEQKIDHARLKPSDTVPLRLSIKSLRIYDKLFSDLYVDAVRQAESLQIKRFDLRRNALFLSGNGRWEHSTDRGHLSSMNLTIRGLGLGEAVSELGFGDSMSGGAIDFKGGFTWPAAFLDLDLETLVGDASLRIEDGVLNNVEPGSGRFVGLLSLSALPRRLSLDFSDLLIQGMEFDEITGKYHLEQGNLITKNTRMEGPAAKIKISGKTGIIRRDYDQIIRVTPNIRQTLPLLGAVSAGSTVGWGLLLLQNLFKKVIDDAVEVEYHVTGSWDDPNIELVKAVDENQQELPKIDK